MHEENLLPIREFLVYHPHLVAKPQYDRLFQMGHLSQAWKILSPYITNEHLTDYFIEKKLGKSFLSRIYSMEMAEMDLRMYLQNHGMLWSIMKQICETLEFIYNLGFHHNDVHPGNILLMNTATSPFILLWDFEKMTVRNSDEELFDLISLCNSFTYIIADALWDQQTINLVQQILSKDITTWKDVNNFILKNHQPQPRRSTTPDNI
jgi:tRNA A-37 threonylcarbamoyl transferase component Bud32